MTDVVEKRRCAKADCNFAEDGICVDDLPLDECPSLTFEQEEEGQEEPTEGGLTSSQIRTLPNADQLQSEDVDLLLRQRPATVVAFFGPAFCGKTTLIAEFYELVRVGVFGGYTFKSSDTIRGLEKRAFHARQQSGNADPDTMRTTRGEGLHFLHLQLATTSGNLQNPLDLVFSDRPGETVSEALDTPNSFAGMVEAGRASVLAILVDGEALASDDRRGTHLYECSAIVRCLAQEGVFSRRTQLQLVLTKYDVVSRSSDKETLEAAFDNFATRAADLVGADVWRTTVHKISCRPAGSELPAAFGIEPMFAEWLDGPSFVPKPVESVSVNTASDYDRLLPRILSGGVSE